jgi:hypothetical protein
MRPPAISDPSGIAGERRQRGQPPDAGRCMLCVYCRTDRFVYWPSAIRLSLADCPSCQRREPAGRDIAPLDGRSAGELSRTTPTARESLEPLTRPVPRRLLGTNWVGG